MLKFLFGVIFLMVAGLLGWIAVSNDNFCLVCGFKSDSSSTNVNVMQNLLIADLQLAAKNKELPDIWNQVLEVRYLYHSQKIQSKLNNNPIVSINKKGSKRMLVEFYDEPDDENFILVRYNIIDIASGNTVGEISRRLKLPAALKSDSTKSVSAPTKKK